MTGPEQTAAEGSDNVPCRDAIVVGAGFGGLYALYKLREIGLDVHAYEAGNDVGGVWYWNRYPGARVDSESSLYSYSFSKELIDDWRWSSVYCFQPEILRYLSHVADRFGLRQLISFERRIISADYDEQSLLWNIRINTGEKVRCRYFITAVGCYSATHKPSFPGLDSFAGNIHYTSEWPEPEPDFSDKAVGIIGTGSTGVQVIATVGRRAKHLTVFQRTANWILPVWNRPTDPEEEARFKANYEAVKAVCNVTPSGFPYTAQAASVADTPPGEREAIFADYWAKGGIPFLAGSFGDFLTNQASNDIAAEFVRARMRDQIRDPRKAELLMPSDHPLFSKRPPMDDDYLDTYNRPNVELVDIKSDPIVEFFAGGVRTRNAEIPLDAVIMATGYDSITGALLRIGIVGRQGHSLQDDWAEGPSSFLGLAVAGFPNLFTITGPFSPSVLVNTPLHIEQQVDWIADCILHMRRKGVDAIEPRRDAQENWVEHSDALADSLLFGEAKSSYTGENIPGKPKKFSVYPGGFAHYREVCDDEAENEYKSFKMK